MRRKLGIGAGSALALALLVACQSPRVLSPQNLPPAQTLTYPASDENFPNPERGFYLQRHGWDKTINPDWEGLTQDEMRQARAQGVSLFRVYYVINEFRGGDLSAAFLERFAQTLSDARQAGVKLIPLFAYAYPKSDDYYLHPERPENQDAPAPVILRHLEQLRPVIQANADVIALWDAGFVGPWGEWHHSTSGLLGGPERWDQLNDKSRLILDKILEVLPPDRMVTLRYPRHKQDLTGPAPLARSEAYARTPKARLGAKNDCFLASYDDWGTYVPDDPQSIQKTKDFLNQDNQYLPQGGETCNAAQDAQPYIGCENALKELAHLRWSTLNVGFEQNVLDGWKRQGCYGTVERKLGYRFRLVEASLPTGAKAGQAVKLTLKMANDGWARPYNPRKLELALREKATGKLTRLEYEPTEDLRLFLPGPGETKALELSLTLPQTLAAGGYELLLGLPDPAPVLYPRPEYAIRLANQGVWEEKTGLNRLNAGLEVAR